MYFKKGKKILISYKKVLFSNSAFEEYYSYYNYCYFGNLCGCCLSFAGDYNLLDSGSLHFDEVLFSLR